MYKYELDLESRKICGYKMWAIYEPEGTIIAYVLSIGEATALISHLNRG